MMVNALQVTNAIIPFVILMEESIASEAPNVPIEMADIKLKKVFEIFLSFL